MINPAKKATIKKMVLGAAALAALICIPKVGTVISAALGSVREKIGG